MNSSEHQKLYELETTYWWHVGRRTIVAMLIGRAAINRGSTTKQILDVGCGTGENIKLLSQFGQVYGIDSAAHAIEFCRKRGLENARIGKAERLPYPSSRFDLVTMLDLLEHLEEDMPALTEAFRVLKPEGCLLISVPAYRALWSEHDLALGHKRRYSRRELRHQVEKAGFKVNKLSFAITILFLPILLFRLSQKVLTKGRVPQTSYIILPNWLNKLFVGLLKLEARFLNHINLPWGVSLVCVAKKGLGKSRALGE